QHFCQWLGASRIEIHSAQLNGAANDDARQKSRIAQKSAGLTVDAPTVDCDGGEPENQARGNSDRHLILIRQLIPSVAESISAFYRYEGDEQSNHPTNENIPWIVDTQV